MPKKPGRPSSDEISTESVRQVNDAAKMDVQTEDNETAHKIKWSLADKYYHAWVASEKLSKSKFLTFYNKLNLTDLPKSYFNSIVDNFTNGWIPLEDEEWIKFSKGF